MLTGLRTIGKGLKQNLKVYQLALKDRRTPRLAKFLLWLAVGYMFLPFDLIPDFIPIIGHLDDAIVIPLLVFLALKMIPKEVIDDCKQKATLKLI